MFTKLELRMLAVILFMTVAFAIGAYSVYNNTLTLNYLSAIAALWFTGCIMLAAALLTHLIQNKNLNIRRIVVKDN